MNPLSPGNPIEASVMMSDAAVSRGTIFLMPPYSLIKRV